MMTLRTLPRLLLPLAALLLLALPVAATAMAETPSQAPGQRFEIDPGKLPAPYATDAVANVADLVDRPSPPPFRLPPGFSVNEFAGGLSDPRWMTVAPNGDVFLTLPRLGQVLLLRDKDGDGKAELKTVFAAGFQRPHGLAIQEGYLYVAGTDGLWRVKLGGDRATTKPEMVTQARCLRRRGASLDAQCRLLPRRQALLHRHRLRGQYRRGSSAPCHGPELRRRRQRPEDLRRGAAQSRGHRLLSRDQRSLHRGQ